MPLIKQISPDIFSIQDYTFQDYDIVSNFEIVSLFHPDTDIIEKFTYDANNNLLDENYNFKGYSITDDPSIINLGGFSTINLNPEQDLNDENFNLGQYNVIYNFTQPQLNSNNDIRFYIKEISSDRTELRLSNNYISLDEINTIFPEFKLKLESEEYFNEFYLNFGSNKLLIAINAHLVEGDIFIKLYNPLPSNFNLKDTCWVVLKVADPIAYNIDFITEIKNIDLNVQYLKGPNTNIQLKDEINNSTELKSYSDIISTVYTSSFQQIKNILNKEDIDINIDYTDFSEFIKFSSTEQRLLNFYDKISLIESYQNDLNNVLNQITGSTSSSYYTSGSKALLQEKVDNMIQNFDGYEYYLYFESSSYAWPKSNSFPPYNLYPTGSTQVLDWIGNSNENAGSSSPSAIFPYGKYGGMALSASKYDSDNQDNLLYLIPSYLRNDSQNQPYELFIEMMGQHFDNIWIYIKDITKKFDADNRLKFGISKDLVAQAIRDLGLKIYQNNFSQEDLYSAFLGITPSGLLSPSTGSEFITSYISASSDVFALDDVNKTLYKRLYHNVPYMLKKKGTIQGLKALISSYGIPSTILRISEFGGKDKIERNDWDYWYYKYNTAFETSGSKYITTPFIVNPDWGATNDIPGALAFRFKTEEIPPTYYSQSLWQTDNGLELVLKYTGSALISGSYSGSIKDNYNQYANLIFYPTSSFSASVYLPIFNGDWWSVLINSSSVGYDLYVKNKIYQGEDSTLIGFQASSSITGSTSLWENANFSIFAKDKTYNKFSGSLQEIRYYKNALSESVFNNYVMNPLSIEGNSLNSSPEELIFRAALGSELEGTSLTTQISIHPKITGSWAVTQSFALNSDYIFNAVPYYSPNTEYIFIDEPIYGIRNRNTDKIKVEDTITPPGDVLSQYISIEQNLPILQSYTPDINLLEVAFSPQNEINDNIAEQLGGFNIGNYIGDPRYISSSRSDYEDLTRLSKDYFEKYTHNYDVYDYIRLIKYFDNSLFKMIKDFVPARTSLTSGIVIKQHSLERNRHPQPQLSPTTKLARVQGEGSLSGSMIDYNVKDLTLTSSIELASFEMGPGGSANILNQLAYNPYEQSIGTELPFTYQDYNITQSQQNYIDGVLLKEDNSQVEFYNGEYSGSVLTVTTQSLHPACRIFLHPTDEGMLYIPTLWDTTRTSYKLFNPSSDYGLFKTDDLEFPVRESEWLQNSIPGEQQIFIGKFRKKYSNDFGGVKYIRISKTGRDDLGANVDNTSYLEKLISGNTIKIYFDDLGIKEFKITSVVELSTYFQYTIDVNNTDLYGSSEYIQTKINTSASITFIPSKVGSLWGIARSNDDGRNFVSLETSGTGSTTDNFFYLASPQVNDVPYRVRIDTGSLYQTGSALSTKFYPRFNTASEDYDWSVDSGRDLALKYHLRGTGINSNLYGEPLYPTNGYLIKISGSLSASDATPRAFRFFSHNLELYDTIGSANFENYIKYLTTNPFNDWLDASYCISKEVIISNPGDNSFETCFVYGGFRHSEDLNKGSLIFGISSSVSGSLNSIYDQTFYELKLDIQPITASYGNFADPLNIVYNIPEGSPCDIIIEPYFSVKFQNSDCDVLAGNVSENRKSNVLMDVDYSYNTQIPINQDSILSGSATKASVQDSNYTLARHINSRYNGSRTSVKDLNVWDVKALNTYGKLPTIDQKRIYFAYFDFINDLSPELKGKSIAHIKYLIDENGNKLPPDESLIYITQGTFKSGEDVVINLNDTREFEIPMDILNGYKTIHRGGQRVDSILYSDSGSVYAPILYFDTGSFNIKDYSFGVRRDTTYSLSALNTQLYVYDTSVKPADITGGEWDVASNMFIFNEKTQTPITFKAQVDSIIPSGYNLGVFLMKNYATGSGTGSNKNPINYGDILDYEMYNNPPGVFSKAKTHNFKLQSSYQNFNSGDNICVVVYNNSNFVIGLNSSSKDSFTSENLINSTGSVATPYWTTGSTPDTWLTASSQLSMLYTAQPLDMVEYDGTVRRSEFDPITSPFTIQTGDEFRFKGTEAYTRMVKSIILPQDNNGGLLYVELDSDVPSNPNYDIINHFLIRRYIDDASYIILNTSKPIGATSPGTVKPKFITDKLKLINVSSLEDEVINRKSIDGKN